MVNVVRINKWISFLLILNIGLLVHEKKSNKIKDQTNQFGVSV